MKLKQMEIRFLRERWKFNGILNSSLEAMISEKPWSEWGPFFQKTLNEWEKTESPDLRGIELKLRVVGKLLLFDFLFDYSDFYGTKFTETGFQGAVLSSANFESATFQRIQMSPIYGSNVNFTRATFKVGFLMESKLTDCSFNEVQANGTSFSKSDISGSSFIEAEFEDCEFDSCLMMNTNLQRANFRKCDFSWAILNGSQLTHTIFNECDMSGTDFRGAKLDGTQIRGGTFGVVEDRGTFTPTRFDDTPELRELVRLSTAQGSDDIEWCPIIAA
jgi:uncharacterized protein YjbI with pentapeptide repeats